MASNVWNTHMHIHQSVTNKYLLEESQRMKMHGKMKNEREKHAMLAYECMCICACVGGYAVCGMVFLI